MSVGELLEEISILISRLSRGVTFSNISRHYPFHWDPDGKKKAKEEQVLSLFELGHPFSSCPWTLATLLLKPLDSD